MKKMFWYVTVLSLFFVISSIQSVKPMFVAEGAVVVKVEHCCLWMNILLALQLFSKTQLPQDIKRLVDNIFKDLLESDHKCKCGKNTFGWSYSKDLLEKIIKLAKEKGIYEDTFKRLFEKMAENICFTRSGVLQWKK